MSPLHGCVLKLNRAEAHLHEIKDLINEYLASPFYEVSGERDYRGRLVARVNSVMGPPAELSVLIGDAVHNFRSALDHLAYALAAGHTRPLPDRFARTSAFPIFRSGPLYSRKGPPGAAYKMRGMSRGARAVMQRLQPYHRRKRPKLHALWMLEELSNIDKHRLVHLTGAALVGTSFELEGTGFFRLDKIEVLPRPIEDGAVVGRFYGEFDLDQGVRVNAHIRGDVIFDTRADAASVRGRSVLLTLLEIRDCIAFAVLHELAPELKRLYPEYQWTIETGD